MRSSSSGVRNSVHSVVFDGKHRHGKIVIVQSFRSLRYAFSE